MALERADDAELERETERWMQWGVLLLFAFAMAFPVYRLLEPNRRAHAHELHVEQQSAHGAELFELNCASCHGLRGRGGLGPALNSQGFLASASDVQIRQLIAGGVPGSTMSAYSVDFGGPMTLEQIESIVVYLRAFEEEAPDLAMWRTPLADENLTGRELFGLACASCHGFALEGGDDAPDLGRGSDAAEESYSRLVKRIREGKDEMPSFQNTLTQEQIDLLIDYLREIQAAG